MKCPQYEEKTLKEKKMPLTLQQVKDVVTEHYAYMAANTNNQGSTYFDTFDEFKKKLPIELQESVTGGDYIAAYILSMPFECDVLTKYMSGFPGDASRLFDYLPLPKKENKLALDSVTLKEYSAVVDMPGAANAIEAYKKINNTDIASAGVEWLYTPEGKIWKTTAQGNVTRHHVAASLRLRAWLRDDKLKLHPTIQAVLNTFSVKYPLHDDYDVAAIMDVSLATYCGQVYGIQALEALNKDEKNEGVRLVAQDPCRVSRSGFRGIKRGLAAKSSLIENIELAIAQLETIDIKQQSEQQKKCWRLIEELRDRITNLTLALSELKNKKSPEFGDVKKLNKIFLELGYKEYNASEEYWVLNINDALAVVALTQEGLCALMKTEKLNLTETIKGVLAPEALMLSSELKGDTANKQLNVPVYGDWNRVVKSGSLIFHKPTSDDKKEPITELLKYFIESEGAEESDTSNLADDDQAEMVRGIAKAVSYIKEKLKITDPDDNVAIFLAMNQGQNGFLREIMTSAALPQEIGSYKAIPSTNVWNDQDGAHVVATVRYYLMDEDGKETPNEAYCITTAFTVKNGTKSDFNPWGVEIPKEESEVSITTTPYITEKAKKALKEKFAVLTLKGENEEEKAGWNKYAQNVQEVANMLKLSLVDQAQKEVDVPKSQSDISTLSGSGNSQLQELNEESIVQELKAASKDLIATADALAKLAGGYTDVTKGLLGADFGESKFNTKLADKYNKLLLKYKTACENMTKQQDSEYTVPDDCAKAAEVLKKRIEVVNQILVARAKMNELLNVGGLVLGAVVRLNRRIDQGVSADEIRQVVGEVKEAYKNLEVKRSAVIGVVAAKEDADLAGNKSNEAEAAVENLKKRNIFIKPIIKTLTLSQAVALTDLQNYSSGQTENPSVENFEERSVLVTEVYNDWGRHLRGGDIAFEAPQQVAVPFAFNQNLVSLKGNFKDGLCKDDEAKLALELLRKKIDQELITPESIDKTQKDAIVQFIIFNGTQFGFCGRPEPFMLADVAQNCEPKCFLVGNGVNTSIWADEDGYINVNVHQSLDMLTGEDYQGRMPGAVTVDMSFKMKYVKGANPPWSIEVTAPEFKVAIDYEVPQVAREAMLKQLRSLELNRCLAETATEYKQVVNELIKHRGITAVQNEAKEQELFQKYYKARQKYIDANDAIQKEHFLIPNLREVDELDKELEAYAKLEDAKVAKAKKIGAEVGDLIDKAIKLTVSAAEVAHRISLLTAALDAGMTTEVHASLREGLARATVDYSDSISQYKLAYDQAIQSKDEIGSLMVFSDLQRACDSVGRSATALRSATMKAALKADSEKGFLSKQRTYSKLRFEGGTEEAVNAAVAVKNAQIAAAREFCLSLANYLDAASKEASNDTNKKAQPQELEGLKNTYLIAAVTLDQCTDLVQVNNMLAKIEAQTKKLPKWVRIGLEKTAGSADGGLLAQKAYKVLEKKETFTEKTEKAKALRLR